MSRDDQMKEEKRKKKRQEREEFEQELAIVNRLKDEMTQERMIQLEKKKQEREYLQLMLAENEKHKHMQQKEKEREKLEDVAAQEAYTRMLLQQERDRAEEFERREKRAQEFMGRMADTVLKQMDIKQKEEQEKIRQFEMEKEMQERLNDQLMYQKVKSDQQRIKDELFRQIEEKKMRERMEKEHNDEQARMWALD